MTAAIEVSERPWSCAVPDWWDRLSLGRSIMPALPLHEIEATRAARVFDKMRLPDVPGQPLLADAAGDWFRDIVRALFGSMDRTSRHRLINNVFLLVPKKNSKTTNGAALMLTALLLNDRRHARFGLFGPTQEISALAFDAAVGIVEADDELKSILHIQHHLKTIRNRLTQAELSITTFDLAVATGGKFAGWLLDEAHLLSRSPYAGRLLTQLRGARVAIPESFGVIITTQSDTPPAGAFKAELQTARAVRDGRLVIPGLLPQLYEFPETVQTDPAQPWLDEAMWPAVLPNVERSVSVKVLRDLLTEARAKGEEEIRVWASQHLNIEIGLALHVDRWRGADHWQAAADASLTLDEILRRSEVATIGIDGGGLDDLLALTVIGREKGSKRWLSWSKAWVDPSIRVLRPKIAADLDGFVDDGDLAYVVIAPRADGETGGGAPHLDDLVAVCVKVWESGLLPEKHGIGLDSAGVTAILDALIDAGIPQEHFAAVPQGYRLSGTIVGTAIRLKAGSMRHADQRLMTWAVSNARAELRGSAQMITKQAAGWAKIDPLMSLFDAADRMSANPVAVDTTSFWERQA